MLWVCSIVWTAFTRQKCSDKRFIPTIMFKLLCCWWNFSCQQTFGNEKLFHPFTGAGLVSFLSFHLFFGYRFVFINNQNVFKNANEIQQLKFKYPNLKCSCFEISLFCCCRIYPLLFHEFSCRSNCLSFPTTHSMSLFFQTAYRWNP